MGPRIAALDPPALRALALFSTSVGCAAALVGCLVLVGGWCLGVHALQSVLPGMSTMKPNTAVCLMTLGASLALTVHGVRFRLAGEVAATIALGVGLTTLLEYGLSWNAGIDELLFKNSAAAFPGRPAAATAFMISLLGAALLCVGRPALRLMKAICALSASLIAWGALNAYMFGAQTLAVVPLFSSVALHTAAVLLVLSLGVLTAQPEPSPIRIMLSKGVEGIVCRWLLPPAILAPPFLGWFLTRGGARDLFPSEIDWALYSVASTLGSVGIIALLTRRIALINTERARATELSNRDPLTGLANRRAFDAFLLEGFNLAKRHGHGLSLMLLDVDFFKSYNDTYGHPAGDELLQSLAALLTSLVRETDLVARVGGEEFAIVMPETDLAGARLLAESAREEVERCAIFRRRVTVSVGVAATRSSTESVSGLVQDCDAALYRAKAAGRNHVSPPAPFGKRSGMIF